MSGSHDGVFQMWNGEDLSQKSCENPYKKTEEPLENVSMEIESIKR